MLLQGLLKKHEAFEIDFAVHRDRCVGISSEGQQLIAEGNHHSDSISQRLQQLHDRLNALDTSATRRKSKLKDNSAYLQFMWKADVVESWIGRFLLFFLKTYLGKIIFIMFSVFLRFFFFFGNQVVRQVITSKQNL